MNYYHSPTGSQQYRNECVTANSLQQGNDNVARDINYGPVTNIFNPPPADSQQEQDLAKLPCADGAAFNFRRRNDSLCLPDTRVDVLEQIRVWADSRDGRSIFWLNGMAGTGKSTIARTVARQHHTQNQLGASFFFSKGEKDLSNASKFFTAIAVQLTQKSPSLRSRICEAAAKNRDIAARVLSEQWELLVLGPLTITEVNSLQSPLLLIIDALDECESESDIKEILRLPTAASTITAIQLRVIVTSRPETPIRLSFRKMTRILHGDLVLHNVPREIIDHDIAIYIRDELEHIELSEHVIRRLIEKAGGLFIWAATVCRFIKDGKRVADTRLSLVLKDNNSERNPEKELDNIYTKILLDLINGSYNEEEKDELFELFRKIVGAIVILFDPLSAEALGRLLKKQKSAIDQTLGDLQSVLEIPESQRYPIRLLHPSFRDFLLSKERCQNPQLRLDEKQVHGDMAKSCLRLISDSLRMDMCDLSVPGTLMNSLTDGKVEYYLTPDVQYACKYWVQHLQQSKACLRDNDQVHQFLQKHILHWLEALSLMGRISDVSILLRMLESILTSKSNSLLLAMIQDLKRFILRFGSIIEKAPLQTHCAALAFSPQNSEIRQQFWHQRHPRIKRVLHAEKNWNYSRSTLEGHLGPVYSVVFSPDGQLVASVSSDKTVRLWDAATGAARGTLKGHSGHVNSVVFSPDSQLVASASHDNTVRLWDAATEAARGTLKGHSGSVKSVVFSPDGQLVASASSDRTVRLWDAATGAARGTFSLDVMIQNLSFSASGQHLKTEPGVLDVRSFYTDISFSSSSYLYGLFLLSNWVAEGKENILWLPPEYRASCVTVWNGIIVLGHSSGDISFIELNQRMTS